MLYDRKETVIEIGKRVVKTNEIKVEKDYRDIELNSKGDIEITKTERTGKGVDIGIEIGVETIVKGLMRRITTPINGYARNIRENKTKITKIDKDKGNEVFKYISAGRSKDLPTVIKEALVKSAEKDKRVKIINVEFNGDSYLSEAPLEFKIHYSVDEIVYMSNFYA